MSLVMKKIELRYMLDSLKNISSEDMETTDKEDSICSSEGNIR